MLIKCKNIKNIKNQYWIVRFMKKKKKKNIDKGKCVRTKIL